MPRWLPRVNRAAWLGDAVGRLAGRV